MSEIKETNEQYFERMRTIEINKAEFERNHRTIRRDTRDLFLGLTGEKPDLRKEMKKAPYQRWLGE